MTKLCLALEPCYTEEDIQYKIENIEGTIIKVSPIHYHKIIMVNSYYALFKLLLQNPV